MSSRELIPQARHGSKNTPVNLSVSSKPNVRSGRHMAGFVILNTTGSSPLAVVKIIFPGFVRRVSGETASVTDIWNRRKGDLLQPRTLAIGHASTNESAAFTHLAKPAPRCAGSSNRQTATSALRAESHFQRPPHRTQHADFPHYALLHISRQEL